MVSEHALDTLAQLHADIETRVNSIRNGNPDWLCRKGCDNCCHKLAEIPYLTEPEWHLLSEGLSGLPAGQVEDIRQKLIQLTRQTERPVVCPLLDLSEGACRVYAYRPIACRTYGYYQQNAKGVYCRDIESRVAMGDWQSVVWGNHNSVDRQIKRLGENRPLDAWFEEWDKTTRFK